MCICVCLHVCVQLIMNKAMSIRPTCLGATNCGTKFRLVLWSCATNPHKSHNDLTVRLHLGTLFTTTYSSENGQFNSPFLQEIVNVVAEVLNEHYNYTQ